MQKSQVIRHIVIKNVIDSRWQYSRLWRLSECSKIDRNALTEINSIRNACINRNINTREYLIKNKQLRGGLKTVGSIQGSIKNIGCGDLRNHRSYREKWGLLGYSREQIFFGKMRIFVRRGERVKRVMVGKGEFLQKKGRGFEELGVKIEIFRGWGSKMGVLVEKQGFGGFLIKKSGKSRKEPGI